MREGICGNINKLLSEGIVCRQEIETNRHSDHCKLTMVRFECNNLLFVLLLQSKLLYRYKLPLVEDFCVLSRDDFAAKYLEDLETR